ncbi:MAG: RnfABCDGE type electron transport complex subunit G [Thermodesulfobacteriota bacterium]|nr:RnfABCDGE type electron transport complex subunit G [Thermodesulfobacteriota bacterium]
MQLREIIKMIVVLTLMAAVCGGGLSLVKMATAEQITYQKIKNIKEPALKKVLTGYDNDPVTDRKDIVTGKDKKGKDIITTFFFAKSGGKVISVAFETSAGGFHGDVGVMVAVNPATDKLDGCAITTQTETPGVGTRVADDPSFCAQFKDKSVSENFGLTSAGGVVQGLSGATVSSTGVSNAMKAGIEVYKKYKSQLGV